MSGFVGELDVRCVRDDKVGIWEHLAPFGFHSDLYGVTIMCPVGSRTDFCTVLRAPGVYTLLGNRARKSGACHDALYAQKITPREVSDKILHEMLLLDGMNEFEANAMYNAVRLFGGSHW